MASTFSAPQTLTDIPMPSPLTRTFRPGLPSGPNEEQRPVRGNLTSGLGMNKQYEPRTPFSGVNPTEVAAPASTPVARVGSAPRPAMARPITGLRRVTPNAGGTITRNGVTTTFAPSPYNPSPDRPNLGGTMTRNGITKAVPPGAAASLATPAAPVAAATTVAAPQTESNNPLTGDTNQDAEDTTQAVDPGQALGLNQRGSSTARGADAIPGSGKGGVGGTGIFARQFANPKSAGLYDSYVRKIFG